ncbi:heme ABC exporter ATP-binding protein CcmA [Devosia oryziradicis]|uniref:Heme ABC exporter ATP-binding protein CcmA n=1 Tax=Devosia oryziradicis TaxID=2801335 RepID=A0ABX7BYP4_9HYPH|nr:heme ABC exporter ATP-binding protein CcmA [Devosia oryziradicis]QQR36628.1 heme ABC exporter ATP-binding protein CcmA [Devosia oryziradicis]
MTQRQVFPPLTLVATGLVCGRGGIGLTAALSFSVGPGQCLLLRGPNGSGKTTLLLTLANTVAPLAGAFALEGQDPDAGPQLHHCGHRNAIKPRLSVLENLDFWRAVNGATGIATRAALDEVGLGPLADLDAGYLSAGQSRRLALARLLVSHRSLWLLDEPTAALDLDGHALLTRLIDRHLDMGGLAIAATHDPITLPDPARMETLVLGARP